MSSATGGSSRRSASMNEGYLRLKDKRQLQGNSSKAGGEDAPQCNGRALPNKTEERAQLGEEEEEEEAEEEEEEVIGVEDLLRKYFRERYQNMKGARQAQQRQQQDGHQNSASGSSSRGSLSEAQRKKLDHHQLQQEQEAGATLRAVAELESRVVHVSAQIEALRLQYNSLFSQLVQAAAAQQSPLPQPAAAPTLLEVPTHNDRLTLPSRPSPSHVPSARQQPLEEQKNHSRRLHRRHRQHHRNHSSGGEVTTHHHSQKRADSASSPSPTIITGNNTPNISPNSSNSKTIPAAPTTSSRAQERRRFFLQSQWAGKAQLFGPSTSWAHVPVQREGSKAHCYKSTVYFQAKTESEALGLHQSLLQWARYAQHHPEQVRVPSPTSPQQQQPLTRALEEEQNDEDEEDDLAFIGLSPNAAIWITSPQLLLTHETSTTDTATTLT